MKLAKFTETQNQKFWNTYAKKLKENPRGAHSDRHIVDLEDNFIEFILKQKKPKTLLDIGCGNGSRTIRFAKYVKVETLGLDYSDIMIKHARKILKKQSKSIKRKVSFEVQDATILQKYDKFDIITSCRCFVNQTSAKKQIGLFKTIHSRLKNHGSLIIAEQSQEGLDNLNYIRKKFGLQKIRVPWHNLPIKELSVMPKINSMFKINKINRLGAFYFLSRVIHPAIVYPNEPNPSSIINDISEKAELLFQNEKDDVNCIEHYGSHLLIHFIKK